MSARHLVIFLRAPRLGAGKRRLARQVGAVAAWRFQRDAALRLVVRLAGDRRWRCWLAVTPDGARLPHGWPAGCGRIGQGRGDLACRMRRVFAALPAGPAVIVGSDIPAIEPGHVARAFARLAHADAVFGPAADGGYWLVGLARRRPLFRPFADVRWSSPHALADSLRSLGPGRRVALLEVLEDVDEESAWRRWRGRLGMRQVSPAGRGTCGPK